MLDFIRTYLDILKGFRLKSAGIVFLLGAAGLFESLVLLCIIPLLYVGFSDTAKQSAIKHWLSMVGVETENLLGIILCVFAVSALLQVLLKFISNFFALKFNIALENTFRHKKTKALFGMQWSAYLSIRLGEIVNSIIYESQNITAGVNMLLQGLASLIVVTGLIILAVIVSPSITGIILIFGAITGWGFYVAGKKAYKYNQQASNASSNIGEYITNIFGNAKFFRSTGNSRKAEAEANLLYNRQSTARLNNYKVGEVIRFLYGVFTVLFVVAFLVLMATLNKSFMQVLIFLVIFYRLAPWIKNVQDYFYQARTSLPWFFNWRKRYDFALLHQERGTGTTEPNFTSVLTIKDISFTYPTNKNPVLRDINITVKKGECVAFVGESGSGKTTLIDLITGLLKSSKGVIELDGISFDRLNLDTWRSRIGLVMQDSPVFHTTVLENIAWGDSLPNLEKAYRCAVSANAWEFIERLPEGLYTVVGEKGGRLSGGQRQRIALARALYIEPSILILDEATSALDAESEAKIQEALMQLKGRFSILMVAHRLKTVQMADTIYVLKNGKNVEMGSWNSLLMDTKGSFRKMAELQGMINLV